MNRKYHAEALMPMLYWMSFKSGPVWRAHRKKPASPNFYLTQQSLIWYIISVK